MGNQTLTRIGDFLSEREGRYKPDSDKIANFPRINKIDFSGNFHIVEKKSNTDMILIKPGDLVISGINVAKGAIGIYKGDCDIVATIHYSAYIFDESRINIDFFKHFVKSLEFIRLLKDQVKGGIKTEIKAKHLLPLNINLPSIKMQNHIVSHFEKYKTEADKLKTELAQQQILLKKLRQAILQEAIEGKLTADWRKQNPDVEPASELLARIQQEKEQLIKDKKIKRQKPLPPIKEEEKPFALPDGWEWCRLGEISNYGQRESIEPENITDKKIWILDLEDIEKTTSRLIHKIRYNERKSASLKNKFKKDDILYGKLRPYLDKVLIADEDGFCTTEIMPIRTFANLSPHFLRFILKQKYFLTYINSQVSGMRMPRVKTENARLALIPLTSISEQKAIVAKVEKLFAFCDQLEQQITENQTHATQFMQAVLQEAFSKNSS